MERDERVEICAAHDLAPIFGKSQLGTVTKGLMKKASFWKKREGGENAWGFLSHHLNDFLFFTDTKDLT